MKRVLLATLGLCLLVGAGCHEVSSIEPQQLSLFGHREVAIRGSGFADLDPEKLEVRFGGRAAINVRIASDDTILCLPQGSPTPGYVDLEVEDTRATGRNVVLADALEYLDTPFPQLRRVVNFGPSLSAGVVNMGYDPAGQIRSIPGLMADALGLHFPQRIVLASGIPIMDAPNIVDYLFVGDGARTCSIPATAEEFVPPAGELCDPVIQVLDGELPILGMAAQLIDEVIEGAIQGKGIVGGLFQNAPPANDNHAIPGAQLHDYVYGTRIGFQYLQDLFHSPLGGIRNPLCLGEPVIKRIADLEDPADLVIGYDWFFDSVLFSHPPLHDLMHQLLLAMLVLSNSEFYQGEACPAGTTDGGWRIPLISTENGERSYQPYVAFPETCREMQCPAPLAQGGAGGFVDFAQSGPITLADPLDPKENVVVDWIGLGLIPATADRNGNGIIDIDFENEALNELTAEDLAGILAADDTSDNPLAVLLSNMPHPSASSSGQGGEPGGGDDQFADAINASLERMFAMLDEAFTLAGRENNLVLFDSQGQNASILAGERPDLTHGLDGDLSTQEIHYADEVFTRYGGAFSLDHLHLSETMNASIADALLELLGEHIGEPVPRLDLAQVWSEDPYSVLEYDPSVRCDYQGVCE